MLETAGASTIPIIGWLTVVKAETTPSRTFRNNGHWLAMSKPLVSIVAVNDFLIGRQYYMATWFIVRWFDDTHQQHYYGYWWSRFVKEPLYWDDSLTMDPDEWSDGMLEDDNCDIVPRAVMVMMCLWEKLFSSSSWWPLQRRCCRVLLFTRIVPNVALYLAEPQAAIVVHQVDASERGRGRNKSFIGRIDIHQNYGQYVLF